METIRRLTEADAEESFALSQFAFQYTLTPEDMELRKNRVPWDRQWGYFADDRLAARMTVLPLETWIQGRLFRMGGIASVATWPEHRRRGMVGKLLSRVLAEMREEGQTVSYLAPFSFAFYRRYGWEHSIDLLQVEIPVEQMAMRDPAEGRIVRHGQQDWPLLDRIYAAYASRFNGMLRRDELWWKWRVFDRKPGQIAVHYAADGRATGYMLYEVKQKVMTMHEFIALDEAARQGLWKFAMNHDSMIERAVCTLPSHDPLAFLLVNPKVKRELISYFMARIVDVKEFMERYPFAPGEREDVWHVAIADAYAPWNEGIWRIAAAGEGACAAERIATASDAEGAGVRVDCRCDIQTWTAALMGFQRPEFLHEAGRLRGDPAAAARLEARIPRRATFLADYF